MMSKQISGLLLSTVAGASLLACMWQIKAQGIPFPGPGGVAPGGGGGPLVANAAVRKTSLGTATTAAMDTTGAKILIATLGTYGGDITAAVITDSKSNTWTAVANCAGADTLNNTGLWYAVNPTVGTGHTVSATYTGAINESTAFFLSLAVAAFSGVATSSPLGQNSCGNSTGGTVQPGSITPGSNGQLIITSATNVYAIETWSINSGFTITDQVQSDPGLDAGVALAYYLQPTAAAINPTWTGSGGSSTSRASAIASFKP